jgi:hypothetical protein
MRSVFRVFVQFLKFVSTHGFLPDYQDAEDVIGVSTPLSFRIGFQP